MYTNQIRVCLDAIKRGRAAMRRADRWKAAHIRICYLDGTFELRRRVAAIARQWSDIAGIEFVPAQSKGQSDVRITFAPGGSWSHVGSSALSVPYNQPTMQLGWVTEELDDTELQQVVLHEFGHMLGLVHEHQNPAGGIRWDKDRVYAYYMGYPNYWSRAQVDDNIFEQYSRDLTQFTEFDPHSIMLYPVPEHFTLDGVSIGWNTSISDVDRDFIRRVYSDHYSHWPTDGGN